jgi:small-conductance mechanosensitive channel
MFITAEQATLIAAVIAAIASVFTLVWNILAARSAEMRVAHRQSLEKHIHELSSAIHSTIATTKILTQAKTDVSVKNWRDRATEAQNKLKELRVILRYPLWGITDAMGTLTRLPDWIDNAREYQEYASEFFAKGKSLGTEIDISIRNSYTYGRPPTIYERFRVRLAEKQLENVFEKWKKDDSWKNENGKK